MFEPDARLLHQPDVPVAGGYEDDEPPSQPRRHPMWETHVTTLTNAGVVVTDEPPGRLLALLDT